MEGLDVRSRQIQNAGSSDELRSNVDSVQTDTIVSNGPICEQLESIIICGATTIKSIARLIWNDESVFSTPSYRYSHWHWHFGEYVSQDQDQAISTSVSPLSSSSNSLPMFSRASFQRAISQEILVSYGGLICRTTKISRATMPVMRHML